MLLFVFFSILLLKQTVVWGQVTLSSGGGTLSQGFEGGVGDTYTTAALGATTNLGTDSPPSSRIRTGTRSWQHTTGTTVSTLEFACVDTKGYKDVKITIPVAAISGNGSNGIDGSDQVKIYVALNGASYSVTPDITIGGNATNANVRWAFNGSLTTSTVAGTPVTYAAPGGTDPRTLAAAVATSTYEITIPNLPAACPPNEPCQTVCLKIEANSSGVNEIWAIDDVVITGTAIGAVDESVFMCPPPSDVCLFETFQTTVCVYNAGVLKTDYEGPITLSNLGGTLSGTLTKTATCGCATFNDLWFNNVPTTNPIQLSVTAPVAGLSTNIEVTPTKFAMTVTSDACSLVSGKNIEVTVCAQTTASVTETCYNGNIVLSATVGTITSGGGTQSAVNGCTTFVIQAAAGALTLNANNPAANNITAATAVRTITDPLDVAFGVTTCNADGSYNQPFTVSGGTTAYTVTGIALNGGTLAFPGPTSGTISNIQATKNATIRVVDNNNCSTAEYNATIPTCCSASTGTTAP